MGCKIVCAVCLVLSLLAHVDDVSSRPTGVRGRDVDRRSVTTSPSVQREEQVFGPVRIRPGSERVPNAGSVQKQNGGLKEFVSKTIQHFKLHAPPATIYALPITFIAIVLLCCLTCAIDRPVLLEGSL